MALFPIALLRGGGVYADTAQCERGVPGRRGGRDGGEAACLGEFAVAEFLPAPLIFSTSVGHAVPTPGGVPEGKGRGVANVPRAPTAWVFPSRSIWMAVSGLWRRKGLAHLEFLEGCEDLMPGERWYGLADSSGDPASIEAFIAHATVQIDDCFTSMSTVQLASIAKKHEEENTALKAQITELRRQLSEQAEHHEQPP
ncbi:hypothetical protein V500_04314 [Pseudogymnoascus sp. VKM F-4518 (FW-2643)]|nr:hypothetical protein V500_04314 [Pseudogymnoascus sp. VKM F-4518 (FW-2643)]